MLKLLPIISALMITNCFATDSSATEPTKRKRTVSFGYLSDKEAQLSETPPLVLDKSRNKKGHRKQRSQTFTADYLQRLNQAPSIPARPPTLILDSEQKLFILEQIMDQLNLDE